MGGLDKVKPLEFVTEAKNGEISDAQWERMRLYIQKNFPKGWLHIYIGKKAKPKSSAQRGYYWGVLVKTVVDDPFSGYTKEEVHEINKSLSLKATRMVNGVAKEYTLSTESLDSKDTEEFHEECRRYWLIERGIVIPLPNEDMSWMEGV